MAYCIIFIVIGLIVAILVAAIAFGIKEMAFSTDDIEKADNVRGKIYRRLLFYTCFMIASAGILTIQESECRHDEVKRLEHKIDSLSAVQNHVIDTIYVIQAPEDECLE